MTEASVLTFHVGSPNASELLISELHANFWIDSSKQITVDIGIKLQIPVSTFKEALEIPLSCALQLPPVEGSLRSLDPIIVDNAVARWLFNDATKVQHLGRVGQSTQASVITYRGSAFYVVPSKSIQFDSTNKLAIIRIDLASIADRRAPIYADELENIVSVYTRFQYATLKGSSGFQFTHGALRDHVFLDLRFNDVRGMPAEVVASRSYIPIEQVRVFLIHRLSSAVQLAPKTEWKQYERLLEHRGTELSSYFVSPSKWRRKALIHQWKLSPNSGDGFNAVVVLKAEKSMFAKGFALLALIFLVSLLMWKGYKGSHEALKAAVDGLLAFAIAASLGLLVDIVVKATNDE
jgi:hypothetical protein